MLGIENLAIALVATEGEVERTIRDLIEPHDDLLLRDLVSSHFHQTGLEAITLVDAEDQVDLGLVGVGFSKRSMRTSTYPWLE